MKMLQLEVDDLVRLHDELARAKGEPVFFPCDHVVAAGAPTVVRCQVRDSPVTLEFTGKVTAYRTARGAPRGAARGTHSSAAGAWVRLDGDQIERALRSVNIERGDATRTSLRRHSRHGVVLPVLVEKPISQATRLANISFGGLCLESLFPAPLGQIVQLAIDFGDRTLSVFARIIWRDDKLGRTGMQFQFQNDRVRVAMEEAIRSLADEARATIYARPTVLIVDDEPAIREALERMVNSIGYGTVTASTGAEAVSVARRLRPALIVLDVLMPGMNGVEVCRILKRDADTSSIPAVLVSALPPQELALILQEAGAMAALSKPFRIQAITELCRSVLEFSGSTEESTVHNTDDRRSGDRLPLFSRVLFESRELTCEAILRDASQSGLYLCAPWAEPTGTRGRVTLLAGMERALHLEVEVVRQRNLGVGPDSSPSEFPGMGLALRPGEDREAFTSWLEIQRKISLDNKLVVVVDDDRDGLHILGTHLNQAGFGSILLDLPLGAVDAIVRSKPDLVIVDFMMPGLDGVRLCRQLKQNPHTRDVPVWMYSSLDEERLAKVASAGRADGVLQKGTRPTEIVERVRDFLEPDLAAAV